MNTFLDITFDREVHLMIIVNSEYGQRSNRLNMVYRGIVKSIINNDKLLVANFSDLKDDYECEVTWGDENKVIYKDSILLKVLFTLLKLKDRLPLINRIKTDNIIYDWKCYVPIDDSFYCYAKRFFAPKLEKISGALKFEKEYFDASCNMVAIHIRRGDYRYWDDGKHFFEDDMYCQVMKEVENNEANTKFIIFSNERIKINNYESIKSPIYYSGFSDLEDQYLMSKCKKIIGPTSTFSLWAMRMGDDVELKTMVNENGKIVLR